MSFETTHEDHQSFLDSKPHCLLAFSWIASWLRQLHYYVEGDERMKDYDLFFSKIKTDFASNPVLYAEHLVQCVQDFIDYFFVESNIHRFLSGEFQEIGNHYGKHIYFPLNDLLTRLTDKEKYMFRSLTLDVFYSVVHPAIYDELNKEWTPEIQQLMMMIVNHNES